MGERTINNKGFNQKINKENMRFMSVSQGTEIVSDKNDFKKAKNNLRKKLNEIKKQK